MFKVLTKRERIILFATVGLIIFAACFNFLFAPVLTKNENLNREIKFTRAKLKKYLQLLSQKQTLQSKYNRLAPTSGISEQREDALVEALSALENMAKIADIRIIDIRPQGPVKNANLYNEIEIDLRTEGTMGGYLRFLYDIENSLSLLKVKKFQLTTKPNTPTLEGSFSVSQISLE